MSLAVNAETMQQIEFQSDRTWNSGYSFALNYLIIAFHISPAIFETTVAEE